MADGGNRFFDLKKYYDDLSKLFKSGPMVRHRIASKIAAPGDVGTPIGTARAFLKHTNNAYTSALASYGQYNRLARYSDYNEMESMAEIGSALDLYAEEVCSKGENGEVVKIDSSNPHIRDALNTLFYDVLNLEFNAFSWVRNFCKYGDQFLLIDHHPDYGVLNALPMPVNEIERDEGYDPENPLAYRYRWTTQGNRILENWQVIHFRLLGNDNFLPYGASILEPARRVWRQLILMEDAVMVYRIVRSPERRVFYIGVGNVAPQDVPAFVEKAKTQLKRNQIIDSTTGRVDLRYNPMSTDEDYFIPVRAQGDGTKIDTLPGGQFTGDIEDLQYIQNKLFAALKVPKSYLGYEGDVNAKSTLSQEDVRFARTIQRIQRIFIAELNKVAVIHLYSMGFKGDDLINFEISMANPSTIAEMQRLELWRNKFEVAGMAQEGMFDRQFVYKRLFKISDEDIAAIEEGKRKDKLFDMEIDSIQPAGTPPVAATLPGETPPGGAPGGGAPLPGGLPPPPGEEMGMQPEAQDPNAQIAAPNELIHGATASQERGNPAAMPNLYNYAFNMKKTAMDPDRNYSELMRSIRVPFGEEYDPEETMFDRNMVQLKKFAEDLEKVDILRTSNERRTKKVISG
jgi:hypothetical protein